MILREKEGNPRSWGFQKYLGKISYWRKTNEVYAMQTFPSVTPRRVSTSSSHRSTPSRDLTSANHDIVNSTIAWTAAFS